MEGQQNKLITRLSKSELLSLPGMNNKKGTIKQLREEVKENIARMKLNKKAVRVHDYIEAYKHIDREFNEPTPEQTDDIFDLPLDLYKSAKTEARKEYEKRIREVSDKKQFQKYMKQFMKDARKQISLDIVIGDDEDKRLAFTETLRQIYKTTPNNRKIIVKGYNLNGTYKYFTLSAQSKWNINDTIGHIAGTLDLTTQSSDENPYIGNVFAPVRYELLFVGKEKSKRDKKTKFTIKKKIDKEFDEPAIYEQEIEVDDDFRLSPEGGFFPYINLTNIDLSDFQIFNTVDKDNYKDTCFVYACIKSGVFTEDEIHYMKDMLRTRNLPNDKIIEIAKEFKCHFIIRRIDESKDIRSQQEIKIDTTKKSWARDFKRTVELLLYKEHYMIYKKIPTTVYYIEHQEQINKQFSHIPLEKRMLIRGLSDNKYPKYSNDGTLPMAIFRKIFELGLFREIKKCDMEILTTTEYNNKLNDYKDLDYNEELCCKLINKEEKKEKEWTEIYYSDFETDVTVSPHKPYLNVTVNLDDEHKNIIVTKFTEGNIGENLLRFLKNGSLTYFHNLKYDACFFINTPGWDTKITERTGTVLQIIMTKKNESFKKTLTFRNSYSIIPAPLRAFKDMFGLDVHKEIMAYKLYTEHNIKRRNIPVKEVQEQYRQENIETKTQSQLEEDCQLLIENAKRAQAYNENDSTIDIMKYAIFYCKKDCIVLMKGMMKFDKDLGAVFSTTKTNMLSVHNYLSISAIGYNFAEKYGCFDGCCLLSSKPQNFIQRCVSGGRTMTANNEKQYIEGRIQDFDAVSLYPSAMSIMPGIPKGVPKIIPSDILTEELLNFDTFFAEINITRIKCKSQFEYKFGQIFRKNEVGSKIFDNQPIEHFYIDKRGFQDLLEFYDFEYEFVRGYYFDEGFNNKINKFITILFNLRLKYKKEHNPLQTTIKLLLNSIYGKSILKAVETETKCIDRNKMFGYIYRNYNYITEVVDEPNISKVYVKKIKSIDRHFNLPQFGASVLSWSKHIMNEVMCLAEQNDINIYYQDTDSVHINEKDLPHLAELYKQRYNKDLIGTNMCQFHNDFDSFPGAVGKIYSRKLIALGKKSYLDILVDEEGKEGYHIRMKGVPKQCVLNKCKRLEITVEELYERMYAGEAITFNLLDGSNCFRKTKCYQQTNLPQFERKVHF